MLPPHHVLLSLHCANYALMLMRYPLCILPPTPCDLLIACAVPSSLAPATPSHQYTTHGAIHHPFHPQLISLPISSSSLHTADLAPLHLPNSRVCRLIHSTTSVVYLFVGPGAGSVLGPLREGRPEVESTTSLSCNIHPLE